MLTESQVQTEARALLDKVLNAMQAQRATLEQSLSPGVLSALDMLLGPEQHGTYLDFFAGKLREGKVPRGGYLTVSSTPTPSEPIAGLPDLASKLREVFPRFVEHICKEQGYTAA